MSSDEITRQIIRQIVAESSSILKKQVTQQPQKELTDEEKAALEQEKAVRGLFNEANQSRVSPHEVTEILAAFMMRAVVLNPENNFNVEKELTKDQVKDLIQLCVKHITSSSSIWMETIRIQVYFDTHFPSQYEFLHKEKLFRLEQCAPLLGSIIHTKAKNVTGYEGLYREIVSYILTKSHVGNPTDIRVIRETTAALESVFPQSELNSFINLSPTEKESQLNGLCNLVTGIRLFNKQLGKGGESIESLPELCATELRQLSLLIHQYTLETEQLIQAYKAALDYEQSTPASEVTPEAAAAFREGLVFNRQYLIYLDALQEKVDKEKELLVAVGEKFDATLADLKVTCKSKTTVPVDQVYPQFVKLARGWSEWLDQLFLLAFQRGLLDNLRHHCLQISIELTPIVKVLSDPFKKDIEPEILPEQQVIDLASKTMTALGMIDAKAEVIHPGNMTQYYKLPVEYGGFCPYAVVTRKLVVPGDKNIGLVRYRDQIFSFENLDSCIEFMKNPGNYIVQIVEIAKKHPDLVQILHLYKYFPTVEALETTKSFTKQRLLGQMPIVAEMGCQVDTHVVDSNWQRKYHWNEWELRREALMLVNLKDKRTHSTQTDESHFRRDSETQHYAPKGQMTQTVKNSSSNVPKTVHYLKGLLNSGEGIPKGVYDPFGPKRYHFKVVDISIDHDGLPVPYGGGAYRTQDSQTQKSQ